jgi:hypothetical protein
MAEFVYVLCTVTSVFVAALLFRSYRRSRSRLLMWSTLCFIGLAINNILLVIDLIVVTDVNLHALRSGTAIAALSLLIVGLIWESN